MPSKETFAFDYLRDCLVKQEEDFLQRVERCGFALIDEVDDVLIDEIKSKYYTGESFNPLGLGFYVNGEEKYYQVDKSQFEFNPSLDTKLSDADNHIDIIYKGVSPSSISV